MLRFYHLADVHLGAVPDRDRPWSAQRARDIFESFYRGDRSRTEPGNGSGLGLAVAKRIVESHGGSIRAENRDGLTIIISLSVL